MCASIYVLLLTLVATFVTGCCTLGTRARKRCVRARERIDTMLAEAGSSKSEIIEARIWLKDIGTCFAPMNEVWNTWVDPNSKGVRTCVEANLARPLLLVEIQVIAVQKQ